MAATRVLCTFGVTFGGGIQRVLMDGLPYLNRQAGIEIALGDLYEREDVKARFLAVGVRVVDVGVKCAPYTSLQHGLARQIDRIQAVPRYFRIAQRMKRAARAADIVYVHTYKELTLAQWSGARIVWHCHGLGAIPPFLTHLARQCERVIAVSETVADTLREIGVPEGRIVTILNAVDAQGILVSVAVPPCPPLPRRNGMAAVLVPVASIREQKGIHLLLQAAMAVPQIEVWVTGDMLDSGAGDYAERLLELSRSPELSGRVHFIGFRRDIYSVMLAADIVCVPSICAEGFGMVAAEAMTLGKPVIVSDKGALTEVVQHQETGLIVDPDRPHDLISALEKLTADPEYAQDLGRRAASSVLRRFSYSRWAEDVAKVLKEVTCGNPTNGG